MRIACFGICILIGVVLSVGESSAQQQRAVINVGVIAPLTGGNSERGQDIVNTLILLGELLSDASTKYQYAFVVEDGKCGIGNGASTAAQKLINVDHVHFLVTGCSGETLQAGPLAQKASVLTFAVFSAHQDVKKLGSFIFRTCPDQERAADILARELSCSNIDQLALISEENAFTQGMKTLLVSRLSNRVKVSEDFLPETNDFRAILLRVKASEPKALYFNAASPTSLGNLVKQSRELSLDLPVYAYLHPDDSTFSRVVGTTGKGLKYLGLPEPSQSASDFAKFVTAFRKRFGEAHMEFLVRTTYDALASMAAGIDVEGPEPAKVRDFLASYKAKGATGYVSFDENGDLRDLDYVLKEVGKDGRGHITKGCSSRVDARS